MRTKIEKTIDFIVEHNMSQIIIIISSIFIYGFLCFGENIWLDEAITANFVRLSLPELIYTTAKDVHPPLYYLIIKIAIMLFGDHIYVMKLASFLPFVFILILSYTKIRKIFGTKVSFFYSAFLCVLPCILHKNVEMRMYQWAMFFLTAFGIYLYISLSNPKKRNWLFTILFGVCAAYTHYYALVAVAILYIMVFLFAVNNKKQRLSIIFCCLISGVLYFPWLLVLLTQMQTITEEGWWNEATVSWSLLKEFFFYPVETGSIVFYIVYLLAVILSLFFFVKNRKDKKNKIAICYIAVFYLLCITGFLITIFYRPIFIARFTYPCIALLLLGFCILIIQKSTSIAFVTLIILVLSCAKPYYSEIRYQYNEKAVAELHSFLDDNKNGNVLLVSEDGAIDFFLDYFAKDFDRTDKGRILDYKINDLKKYERIYLFTFRGHNPNEDVLKYLECTSYKKLKQVEIRFHSFDIYELLWE